MELSFDSSACSCTFDIAEAAAARAAEVRQGLGRVERAVGRVSPYHVRHEQVDVPGGVRTVARTRRDRKREDKVCAKGRHLLEGVRPAPRAANAVCGQARRGGPRGNCWRVGPERAWVCATSTGRTATETICAAANVGRVGSGAGPALCAYGQVGCTTPRGSLRAGKRSYSASRGGSERPGAVPVVALREDWRRRDCSRLTGTSNVLARPACCDGPLFLRCHFVSRGDRHAVVDVLG
jgi:hypothetical protein